MAFTSPQDPSISRLAATCVGADRNGGWQIRGNTRHIIRVEVQEVVGGVPRPFFVMAGVADRALSATTHPVFISPVGSPAGCAGASLETIVQGGREAVGGAAGDSIEWRLEFSPGVAGQPSSRPVQMRGNLALTNAGAGEQLMPFRTNDRQFLVRMVATPGPLFHVEVTRRRTAEADARRTGPFSARLPDEQPYRTLEDSERDARQRNTTTNRFR